MDIRGIEVTNQLRSAIRAKLLELGVRYDEELPDYILVMVVNKKTRQQMHEDLHLFLEDSTTPFVEWLHDEVLKKLQKVTIAKKKASREFVPTVVVKQEEERRKRKNSASATTENSNAPLITDKLPPIVTKEEKSLPKTIEKSAPPGKFTSEPTTRATSSTSPSPSRKTDKILTKILPPTIEAQQTTVSPPSSEKLTEISSKSKAPESHGKLTTKRPLEPAENDSESPDKRAKAFSVDSEDFNQEDEAEEEEKDEEEETEAPGEDEDTSRDKIRLKSCVNKPKITSVVSVKNRLGVASPQKNFDIQRTKNLDRYRKSDSRFEKPVFESNRFDKSSFEGANRRPGFNRDKTFEESEILSRNRSTDSRNRQLVRVGDGRNRPGPTRDNGRFIKNFDNNDESTISRLKVTEKFTSTIKDRLGVSKNVGSPKPTIIEGPEARGARNTIKNRLGARFRVANSHAGFVPVKKLAETMNREIEDDRDDCQSVINAGPVKSHVIVLKKPETVEKRAGKASSERAKSLEESEETEEGKSIASKVIVTPRPLKPLQPAQKRATQSLLLRAVAEANQSVVKQKNPEPVLSGNKPKLKRPKPSGTREIEKNLSVHLNATKRLVMEKIQVQLRTNDTEDNNRSKQNTPNPVNDEHMGVVMSLFQRSDNNQKFLVTLNGYNNNVIKEKGSSDEEDEQLEMEVAEDDEFVLSTVQNESYERNESLPTSTTEAEDSEACEKDTVYVNNENHNSENVEAPEEVAPRKRRKLSPIVYNRARSPSPALHTATLPVLPTGGHSTEQRSIVQVPLSTETDKSREKCRYWPNCTLGSKCAYHHPAVPCSAFPACKYGGNCAYKHPKCKFGLSCTKLGCVFSHPKQQCKYHPFCTKPTCPYSHPLVQPVVPAEAIRAKFTWKRRTE